MKFVLRTPRDAYKMIRILENLKKSDLLREISFLLIVIAPKRFEYLNQILEIVNKVSSIRKVVILHGIKGKDNKFMEFLSLLKEYHAS